MWMLELESVGVLLCFVCCYVVCDDFDDDD
jgi:hypothetical protein